MENREKSKKFPPQTAASLMTIRVPLVNKEQRLREVQDYLFQEMNELETINYVYVIDDRKRLVGVFSIKEVFRKPKETRVAEIMERTLVKCQAFTDQEKVAILALKNNLKAIPIIDKEGIFLGVVTSDTILNILHQEHIEDILLAGGVKPVDRAALETATASTKVLVKARFPWLLLGLFGGIFAAQIIGFFEDILRDQILLALFIPVIVYISGAVATQTQTLIIRSIALNSEISIKKYFLREIRIGILLAFLLGLILAAVVSFWWQDTCLGIILGLAMLFSISLSVLVAMLIPIILQKMKKDPALGSGPLATIITDILSIVVYFLVANFLLTLF